MTHPARLSDDARVEAEAQSNNLAQGQVIHTPADFERLRIADLPERPEPQRVLMCSPEHFAIIDVKNSFMEGQIGLLDKAKAEAEWAALKTAFESTGHEVLVIPGADGLEDMVFCANQVLPGRTTPKAKPYVVLSHMRHASRQQEVPHFERWFSAQGYDIKRLPASVPLFEGQGDALWHPGKQLLWGGYGHRTDKAAYDALSQLLQIPIIALELPTNDFYHLDTAMAILSPDTVMIYPGAFSADGLALIRAAFTRVIDVSADEASHCFTCNAHALSNSAGGSTVILQAGATQACQQLQNAGFEVLEVDTREFMKSGGSVFCLKMMVY